MIKTWRGVFPAVCTQFKADELLDIPATLAHIDAMLAAGIHGLVMLGSVGENTALEVAEKKELLAATVKHIKKPYPRAHRRGRVPPRSRHAARPRWRKKPGADGLMVLPPMVYKPDAREAMAHFRSVAKATDLPIMIYNNPPSYRTDITPEMFAELADEPRFTCIKESSDNPRRVTDIINLTKDRYVIFAGVDDLFLECFLLGAIGWTQRPGERLSRGE